ncbi:50S ribosome-binding GTPase [Candidatus Pacearchaeota archaeon]|nr:50S ribosome-binding GTPase [Candidatus Pacearchaeota archaeon]
MPINAHPDFLKAEKDYFNAKTIEEKIYFLEEMIRRAPAHKGGENLRANLKTRLRKLKEKAEKGKKKSGGKKGLRKEGYQIVLVGFTNKGKSTLLGKLTNANPEVSDFMFTTKEPEIGTFYYEGVQAQIVDLPSLESENFNIGIVNNADCILLVVENLEEIGEIEKQIPRARGKRIVVVNKADRLQDDELRKLRERIKSKRINGVIISAFAGFGIDELKQRIFNEIGMIRIYMKEHGRKVSEKPLVLPKGATVKDVAESILKGFSARVKETRLTGPSGKFPNQKVGLNHVVEDRDVVEFHTR